LSELRKLEDCSLEEFGKQDKVIRIKSKLVGEDIWLVPTKDHLEKVSGPEVAYTAKEAMLLGKSTKKIARKIHEFKKTFKGEIF